MENSVTETFRNGTAFITGSTGFVGKLLMEKLLRSCPLKCIAVLVRSKKGIIPNQRVASIYEQPIFDRLRKEKPNFISRVKIIVGNIEESSLGISDSDRDWLIENVNFVFHCAATIKFNESLEFATKINVHGTESLMILATEMKNLQGFVHISTAYSHCPRNEIDEKFYPMKLTAKELKNRLKENKKYNNIENWPNTYSYTKAIAENMVSINEYKLPISVFRPSIIVCTKSEPYPGCIDNINGPIGMFTGIMAGFLRTIPIGFDKVTDLIPTDYTINGIICVMWDTVNRFKNSSEIDKQPKIYNYVSSSESPLTYARCYKEIGIHYYDAPPLQAIWYAFSIPYTQLWIGVLLRLLLHKIPGAILDFTLILRGKKPKMLKMHAKTDETMSLYHTFTTREWKFHNRNTRELWLSQCEEDRQMFPYSFEKFDWSAFFKCIYYGIRENVLKEDLCNIEKALAKNKKMLKMHAKTDETMSLYHTFTTREWKFHNRNTRELWLSQCEEDRQMFPYSFEKFDWSAFFKYIYYGIRENVLKEDLCNIEKE